MSSARSTRMLALSTNPDLELRVRAIINDEAWRIRDATDAQIEAYSWVLVSGNPTQTQANREAAKRWARSVTLNTAMLDDWAARMQDAISTDNRYLPALAGVQGAPGAQSTTPIDQLADADLMASVRHRILALAPPATTP